MKVPGRDQGPGSTPRSRIQPRFVRVNKNQQRAAFGSGGLGARQPVPGVMGLGKLGYPGSWVVWQHGCALPPCTGTRMSTTPWGQDTNGSRVGLLRCGMPWLLSLLQSPTWASSGRKTTSRATQSRSMLCWRLRLRRGAAVIPLPGSCSVAACSPAFPTGAIPGGTQKPLCRLDHRIIEWFGLEGTSNII